MKWPSIFRRKRGLAPLRKAPSFELVMQERAAMAHDALLSYLTHGEVRMDPHTNVAPGTSGSAIIDAIHRGFFRLKTPSRYDYGSGFHKPAVYEVTQAGKNYLAGIPEIRG